MSHPKNRRERFEISVRKGYRRATQIFSYNEVKKKSENYEHVAHKLRNVTKLCGKSCCRNPRKNGWNKNKHCVTIQERKFGYGQIYLGD
jgi:hypothetical protein